MRLFLRAGLALALGLAACKDSPAPADFTDPVAITANLGAVDSAFGNDVYRSFTATSEGLDPAASAALQPAAMLIGGSLPLLNRQRKSPYLMSARRAEQLKALGPQMSVAATQGGLIPDSMYGRVFQYDTAANAYAWQDSVVSGLTGVRFILYQVDDFGSVVAPLVEVGRLDVVDQSTLSVLRLHILVKDVGGTITYVDYTATVSGGEASPRVTASGSVTNGLVGASNKTLTFNETVTGSQSGASISATFTLNNPSITFTINESLTFTQDAFVITVTFRIITPGETIAFRGRISIVGLDSATVNASVWVNGHPVASISGESGTAEWVDAGGEPLTAEDTTALEGLDAAAGRFQEAVDAMFLPITTFFGA
jgi:hypothetical protein